MPRVTSARESPSGAGRNWIVWCIFSTSAVMPVVASNASRAAPRRSESWLRLIVDMWTPGFSRSAP